MKLRLEAALLAIPLLGLGLSACGGSQDAQYSEALPTSDTLAMEMDGLDADSQALTAEAAVPADPCHPHLFKRTANVVHTLNGIINPILKRVDAVITAKPGTVGKTHSWVKTSGDEELRASVTQTATGQYSYDLKAKPQGSADSAYQTVFTGTLDEDAKVSGAGTGTLHVDLTALSKANPKEKATGAVDVTYALATGKKTLVIDLKQYLPDAQTTTPPRDAHYVYTRTADVGGSLKFEEHVALLCPANPDLKEADVKTVARWFHKDATTVMGRSDAMATGGQIAQGRTWMGLTCSTRSASESGAERYWQMKLEGSDGNTVRGDATYSDKDTANPTSSCDAAFGAVPSLDNSSTDFDFSKVNFTDSNPIAPPTATQG